MALDRCRSCSPTGRRLLLGAFGRQAVYRVYPPTPTPTISPTVTLTATLTLTPTITLTPRETHTPSPTPLPTLPAPIAVLVRETVTPPAGAIFSPIVVASRLDELNRPLDGASEWTNSPSRLLGAYTYDQLQNGVRWTALWLRGTKWSVYLTRRSGSGGPGATAIPSANLRTAGGRERTSSRCSSAISGGPPPRSRFSVVVPPARRHRVLPAGHRLRRLLEPPVGGDFCSSPGAC